MKMELVLRAAEAFQRGEVIDQEFLREHQVSSDDCRVLLDLVGTVLRGFVEVDSETRKRLLILGQQQRAISEMASEVSK